MSGATRLLVTGSGGRLGRLLRASYKRGDADGTEIIFQSSRPGFDIAWEIGDGVESLPRADAILALWGVTSGTKKELVANSKLAELSTHIAQYIGAERVLHCSSAAIYGQGANMGEDFPPSPINAYGQAKLEMETHVAEISAGKNCEQTVLRIANIVGADSLAPALTSSKPVTLDRFANGAGPLRSYLAASDLLRVACALAQGSQKKSFDLLNIASPKPIAMEELAKAAGKDIVWRPAPSTATQEVSLNTNKLKSLIPNAIKIASAARMIEDWITLRGS